MTPAALRCDVAKSGTQAVVRLVGELALSTAPLVRSTLLKVLAEQPNAVVVDVADLTVRDPTALSVLMVVAQHAAMWPGTPLLVCRPQPEIAAALATGRHGRLRVFDSVSAALNATPGQQLPTIGDLLLPVSGAARRARDLATEACARWDLPGLTGAASIVANELVVNAVVHAQTMIELRLSLRTRHLAIAVRDGSTAVPVLATPTRHPAAGGNGLRLVDSVARRWGCLPAEGGKVVWALLDLQWVNPKETTR